MNEQPNTVTINVLADRSREARDRLNKLVRKAARYSVNPVSYTVGEVQIVKRQYEGWDGEVCTANVAVVPFTVTGLLPVIGKHTFLARLEHTDAGNIIISKVPGSDIAIADRYRAATPCCEHCKTQRARKDTFVILDRETNEQKQVGRSCLADYVKTGTAASIIASLTNYAEGQDIERSFGGSDFHFSQTLEFIVTATLIAIRKFGWLSRAQANDNEPSTSSHVASLWGFSKEARAMATELRKAWQPGDEEMARKVITWVREEMRVDNDYQHNLRVAYANDVLSSPRNIGLVCSGVASHQRVQEVLIRREFERMKLLKSQHVGTVGERLRNVEVTYLNSRGLGENGFGGYTHLHKFITKDGHVLSWITTSELDRETKQGVVAKLTATVKEHREYAGIKETAVSRAKLA